MSFVFLLKRVNIKPVELALVILSVFLGLIVASRPESIGSDTGMYLSFFEALKVDELLDSDFARFEPGFLLVSNLIVALGGGCEFLFFLVFVFVFLGISCNFFKRSFLFSFPIWTSLFVLTFPFFYSITLNTIRQGVAFVFVLYAVDRRVCGDRLAAVLLLGLACAFHYSSLIYLLAGLLVEVKFRYRNLFLFWVCFSLMSALSVLYGSNNLIGDLIDKTGMFPQFAIYVDGAEALDYEAGFKWHWFLFSAAPVFFVFVVQQFGLRVSKEGEYVLSLYFWLLLIQVVFLDFAYNDRIGIMAWILWPIIFSPSIFRAENRNLLSKNRFFVFLTVVLAVIAPIMFSFQLGLF